MKYILMTKSFDVHLNDMVEVTQYGVVNRKKKLSGFAYVELTCTTIFHDLFDLSSGMCWMIFRLCLL